MVKWARGRLEHQGRHESEGPASLHRANQRFGKEQDVFDVLHYDELGRFKRRITPFITWEPLPILKPGG